MPDGGIRNNLNQLDYNNIMDKIQRSNKKPFSERFANNKILKLNEVSEQKNKGDSQDEAMNKNKIFSTTMNGPIYFESENMNKIEWKILDDYSVEYNEAGEELLKEVNVKYTPGKNFQCKVNACKKVYTSSYGLKYHMDHGHTFKKITEKRPYACPVKGCGRTYKNNNGLKYHIAHVHKVLLMNLLNKNKFQ